MPTQSSVSFMQLKSYPFGTIDGLAEAAIESEKACEESEVWEREEEKEKAGEESEVWEREEEKETRCQ